MERRVIVQQRIDKQSYFSVWKLEWNISQQRKKSEQVHMVNFFVIKSAQSSMAIIHCVKFLLIKFSGD